MKRRWVPVLVCLATTVTVVMAQPKKGPAPKKDPAKGSAEGSAPAPTPTPGSDAGSAAAPPDEGPPPDMEGKDENPNTAKFGGSAEVKVEAKAPEKKKSGYPMEAALRPLNLPRGMAEISIGPRFMASVPSDAPLAPTTQDVGYAGSDTLRARYGITRQVQLGFNYTFAGIYDDPKSAASDKIGFHPGKAIGLDVQYLVKDWLGVKVGVPVWIFRPEGGGAPAIGLTIGVPMKFKLGSKFAIGVDDDLLAIKITKFAPTFEFEYLNALRAAGDSIGTPTPAGYIKLGGYAMFQNSEKLALIGRVGIQLEDFESVDTQSGAGGGGRTFIRGGVHYTAKKYLDVGVTAGFEDLSSAGTFGLVSLLAFRI